MKRILLMLAMVLPFVAAAQVTLQAGLPAVGLIQKNQLWNVLLINSTTKQYDCRLELLLRDRATGQEILTASTGQFILQAGSKQLNVNLLAPIQYNYLLAGFDTKMQGLLPAGSYTACYSLSTTSVKEANLADECVQFDTEPLTPPMLIYPADSSVLEVAPNQFSWIPPTPAGMFDRLQYDVMITPINDGQKSNEAIEENLPFYNEGNHFTNMLSYAGSSPAFEKDKWYAWQVVARDGRDYAGKSEVWVFKVGIAAREQDSIINNYVIIKSTNTNEGVNYIKDANLHLKYYSYEKNDTVLIKLKRSNNEVLKTIKKPTAYGDNLFNFQLSSNVFTEGQIYIIELMDLHFRKYRALFSIRSQIESRKK